MNPGEPRLNSFSRAGPPGRGSNKVNSLSASKIIIKFNYSLNFIDIDREFKKRVIPLPECYKDY
jgi:hypothetical protein